jgi:hypothetical protein
MQIQLLFTDFDGVLHPCLAGTFIYLDRYQEFLRQHPSIRPVLDTTWRLDHPREYLMAMFAPDIRERFLGATPLLDDALPAVREQEILAFRRANRLEHLPWVALDDDASLFSPGCPNLVLCETVRGLRPAQLAQIEAKLGLN